jgi:hypothetical protein
MYPATLAADYSFSIPNEPAGPYFLVLSREYETADWGTVKSLDLTELSSSTPDLSVAVVGRFT